MFRISAHYLKRWEGQKIKTASSLQCQTGLFFGELNKRSHSRDAINHREKPAEVNGLFWTPCALPLQLTAEAPWQLYHGKGRKIQHKLHDYSD